MEDDKPRAAEPGELPRRRRVPPPTIDLTASDVSADPAHATAGEPLPESSPQPEPGPAADHAGPGEPDPPPRGASPAGGPAGEPPPAAESAPPSPPPASSRWSNIAMGARGAILALIAVAAIWALVGPERPAPPVAPPEPSAPPADLDARLARIETQLAGLARPPAAPVTAPAPAAGPADAAARDDLARRLAGIETTLADLARRDDQTTAAARTARERADAAAKSLADVAQQLARLNAERARAPALERYDVEALATRLADLEKSTRQIGDQLAGGASAATAANTGQAVVAFALKSAVDRGAPYAAELAALDPALADPASINALKPFAETGVPNAATLAHDLAAVMPRARAAVAPQPHAAGFLDRLQANAQSLVHIQKIDQPGDAPAAVLSRLEAATARGDIAGALAETAKLPAAARDPLEAWIRRAQAREAALAAAAALASRGLDALHRPAQQGPAPR